MTMSKESQRIEQRLTEVQNALATLEAKLDGLMRNNMKEEDIRKIQLPTPKPIEKISSAAPYRIKSEEIPPEESTIEPPVVEQAEQPVSSTPEPELKDKSTLEPPVTPVQPVAEPVEGYDKLTEGEAIKLAKGVTDPIEQSKFAEYERANKNRERVLEAIATLAEGRVTGLPAAATTTSTPPKSPSGQ